MRCQLALLSTTGSASLAAAGLSQASRLVGQGLGVRRRFLTGHKSPVGGPISGTANRQPVAQASRPDGHPRHHPEPPHFHSHHHTGWAPLRHSRLWASIPEILTGGSCVRQPCMTIDHQPMSCPLAAAVTRCWSPELHLVPRAHPKPVSTVGSDYSCPRYKAIRQTKT